MPSQVMIEKEWEAENDARTLAQAEEIKQDAKRRSAAVNKAKELARKAAKEANTLSAIGKNALKPPTKKKITTTPKKRTVSRSNVKRRKRK